MIGYVSLDETIPFVSLVSQGIRDEVERSGFDLIECDSGWTREGSIDCSAALGKAGVSGVISFQAFDDATSGLCEATGEVPLIAVVFDQDGCRTSLLRIDQARSGRLAGEAVGRFASERWSCEASAFVSLESNDADPAGQQRMQGYRDGYATYCPLPDELHRLSDAVRLITAKTQVAALLPDLPGDRIVVVGLNEDAVLGAMEAAADAGRSADLWYSGQLVDPPIRPIIACDEHYIASVAQFPERFGSLIVPTLVEAIAGRPVADQLEAPLLLVTSDNIRELYPDTPECGE